MKPIFRTSVILSKVPRFLLLIPELLPIRRKSDTTTWESWKLANQEDFAGLRGESGVVLPSQPMLPDFTRCLI